jgi:N4-gp56 family major capsid protein
MSNETTTTTANDLVYSSIISKEIIEAAWSALVCLPLVKEYDISAQPTLALDIPVWVAVSASAVNEASDLSNSAMSTNKVTLTASEVGVMITLTDKLSYSDILGNIDAYAEQLGKALADKIDTDLAALFAGFSGTAGSTGVDITEADFLTAIYTLENGDAPKPYVAVLHPRQVADLRTAIASSSASLHSLQRSGDLVSNQAGFAYNLYNVDVYQTTNVATANTSADRCGAMMSKGQALGIVWKQAAKTELQRDASLRATEVVVTSCYGVGELVDAYGVKIVTDA